MSCRACLLSAGGLMTLAMAFSTVWAAPAPKGESKPDTSAAEAIRKALDTPNTFEFKEQNLAAIIATIAEQYKISIVLDRHILQQMGLAPEEMNVDLNLKNAKLRTALRALVNQYGLSFAISDGTLLITTEEAAVYRQLKQRIDVNFDNVPLNTAVKELTSKYGVNVVFDPKTIKSKAAMNPITLQVEDVPFEAAMRLMCEMAELKPARMGNVIYVTTEARADKLKDSDHLVPAPTPISPFGPNGPGGLNLGFNGFAGFGGNIGNVPAVKATEAVAPEKVPEPKVEEAPAKK